MRTLIALSCTWVALTLCGCSAPGPFKQWFGKREFPKATPENPVVEVVTMWQAAEGTGLSGLPCRGFAGQIMFFTRESQVPVEVNGAVRVYLFDDDGSPEERVKPLHQFDFDAGVWATHLYNGTLGATYQVFIPYTKMDAHRARCSLRIRFQPEGGAQVFSDAVAVTLPGPLREQPVEAAIPSAPKTSLEKLTLKLPQGNSSHAVRPALHEVPPPDLQPVPVTSPSPPQRFQLTPAATATELPSGGQPHPLSRE